MPAFPDESPVPAFEIERAPTVLAPLPDSASVEPGPATEASPPPSPGERDTVATAHVSPQSGEVVALVPDPARYRPMRLIGAGGMGEVRLLHDARIGRDVACKRALPGQTGAMQAARFLREARVQAQLEHPSVVPVYDLGALPDGSLYFTMQRVRGQTLASVVAGLYRKDPVHTVRHSRRKLLDTFARVCLAVHYAHARGVVHRDLKPANVMLGDFGEVYVLDWGVAKIVRGDGVADGSEKSVPGAEPTAPGTMVGSAGFMAPEQVRGENDRVDARTDVYALGVILFELLALEPLHRTTRVHEIVTATLEGVDARPSLRDSSVPADLDAVCVRATARDPDARFQTARELGEAVERYLDGERDAGSRKSLAAVHAAAGARAFERASGAPAGSEEAERARAEALREAVAALALDDGHESARRLLFELVTHVPDKIPASARAEANEYGERMPVEGVQRSFQAMLSYLVCVPFMLAVGVRDWMAAGAGMGSIALAALVTRQIARAPRVTWQHGLAALVLTMLAAGVSSTWMGPFVLLPTMAAVTSMMFALHAARRERLAVVTVCALSVLVPFVLDLSGLVPPGFAFRDGHVELLPRAVGLPRGLTLFGLIYSSVTFAVFPALALGRVRDALGEAQEKLFARAWHVRLLLDSRPPSGARI